MEKEDFISFISMKVVKTVVFITNKNKIVILL